MNLSSAVGYPSHASLSTPAKPIVFVVDDDVSVRESLSLLLRHEGWQSETFTSAQDFLDRSPVMVPSCLLLDICLPGISGLDLQRLFAVRRTVTPIIFITGHGDVPKAVQAFKDGAVEFLTKPLNDEKVVSAVRQALKRSQSALITKAQMDRLRDCHASLTPREQQVMALVVLGKLNKEVAYELQISEITVKAHRGRVMQKMEANSFADLVKMADKLQLAHKEISLA
jgi:FixJ family two-component response regulator